MVLGAPGAEERGLRLCRDRCRSSKGREVLQEQEAGDRGSSGVGPLRCPGGEFVESGGTGHQGSLSLQSPSLNLARCSGTAEFQGTSADRRLPRCFNFARMAGSFL